MFQSDIASVELMWNLLSPHPKDSSKSPTDRILAHSHKNQETPVRQHMFCFHLYDNTDL